MALEDNDGRTLRCRRLGHEVTFRYCRTQEGQTICPLILDCWWETFDVRSFLEEHLEAEAFAALLKREPRPKVTTLLDLIDRARQRTQATAEPDEQRATDTDQQA